MAIGVVRFVRTAGGGMGKGSRILDVGLGGNGGRGPSPEVQGLIVL